MKARINQPGEPDAMLCDHCSGLAHYDPKADAWYCPHCDIWLDARCGDEDCIFCKDRCEKPMTGRGNEGGR